MSWKEPKAFGIYQMEHFTGINFLRNDVLRGNEPSQISQFTKFPRRNVSRGHPFPLKYNSCQKSWNTLANFALCYNTPGARRKGKRGERTFLYLVEMTYQNGLYECKQIRKEAFDTNLRCKFPLRGYIS